MITNFRLVKTDSQAHIPPEEIKAIRTWGINYDIQLKKLPQKRKRNTVRLGYIFSINYINPSIGYLRYEGTIDCEGEGSIKEVENFEELPSELRNEIAVIIVNNLIPMALLLSKLMGLPPASPIPIPDFDDAEQPKEPPKGMYG